jgi:hypothetical protein
MGYLVEEKQKGVAEKLDAKQLYLYKNLIYKDLAQWRQQDQHFQCSELPNRET